MTLNSFQRALSIIDFQVLWEKAFYRSQKIAVPIHHLICYKERKNNTIKT